MAENVENSVDGLSFEDAIKSLGVIVESIEGGDIALESSIAQYEKGMKLIAHCRGILQKAEKKIEKISGGGAGS
jgi:exodeoxyribonuclease VII small subunit